MKVEKSTEEIPSYKYLLLGIVRLIHADPILMLNVRQFGRKRKHFQLFMR